jgi:hypothetical protein
MVQAEVVTFVEHDFTGVSMDRFKEIATSLGFKEASTPLTLEMVLAVQSDQAKENINLLTEMLTKEISEVH